MNDRILKRATARIDEKRHFADQTARQNLIKAYSCAEFKQLYSQKRELEIQIAKKQAYGESYNSKELVLLSQKLELLLKSLGLNGTDIMPNYECKECNDTGYKNGLLCDCLKREISKELLAYGGFSHTLATFKDANCAHPAFDVMQKWCNLNNNKINVVISGNTGTGKTFLTECVASQLIEKNLLVSFTTAFNLNNSMLNYHISFDANRDQILSPYLECDVLIIDDLGTEPIKKNVTLEYLYFILNERMQMQKRTIITTNLLPEDILNTYGERIFSRLSNKKIAIMINLDGDDLRLKK